MPRGKSHQDSTLSFSNHNVKGEAEIGSALQLFPCVCWKSHVVIDMMNNSLKSLNYWWSSVRGLKVSVLMGIFKFLMEIELSEVFNLLKIFCFSELIFQHWLLLRQNHLWIHSYEFYSSSKYHNFFNKSFFPKL